ncbi:hypothetical protein B0J11DRAFT_45931 [Dendryphion nanum]|uniref:Uncharacterized protein n=1 Tax=Dendryphion nanum TaxID=256645 RepID=A0A9P9J2B9_9PLEO|nr:hypothetical protein B0J11DRAFT_45931 [Dendryphion nanum]
MVTMDPASPTPHTYSRAALYQFNKRPHKKYTAYNQCSSILAVDAKCKTHLIFVASLYFISRAPIVLRPRYLLTRVRGCYRMQVLTTNVYGLGLGLLSAHLLASLLTLCTRGCWCQCRY